MCTLAAVGREGGVQATLFIVPTCPPSRRCAHDARAGRWCSGGRANEWARTARRPKPKPRDQQLFGGLSILEATLCRAHGVWVSSSILAAWGGGFLEVGQVNWRGKRKGWTEDSKAAFGVGVRERAGPIAAVSASSRGDTRSISTAWAMRVADADKTKLPIVCYSVIANASQFVWCRRR